MTGNLVRETGSIQPGQAASGDQILHLANVYSVAADALISLGKKGDPVSRAPFRLLAIHAIELYLSAYLLKNGATVAEVRALQHSLSKRVALAIQNGLTLRKLTVTHLHALTSSKEYLVSRYGPELSTDLSQLNRLKATLYELRTKVTLAFSTAKQEIA